MLNNGLPEQGYIRSFAMNGNDIFVGNYAFGVFLSTDSGDQWTGENTGLPSTRVSAMAVIDDEIYVGTGFGLWKHSLSDIYSLSISLDSTIIDAPENSTVTFDVSTSTNWRVSCSEPWLTASPDSGSGDSTFTLTASANPGTSSRTSVVTVSGTNVNSREIFVSQKGLSTGVYEWDDNDIQVYPNPTRDYITVSIGNYSEIADLSMRIFNSIGVKLFEAKVTQTLYQLDLSSWTGKGIYVLQSYDSNYSFKVERKIVVQ